MQIARLPGVRPRRTNARSAAAISDASTRPSAFASFARSAPTAVRNTTSRSRCVAARRRVWPYDPCGPFAPSPTRLPTALPITAPRIPASAPKRAPTA